MEREKIKLTNERWEYLVWEQCLEIDGEDIEIKVVETGYDGSRRHTENHHLVFQRISDGKFFRVNYETSVKDEMGWNECNYGDTVAFEVFPETQTITIFK